MKTKLKPEYRNLQVEKNVYTFEVKRKDNSWTKLTGLDGSVSKADAIIFAQKTAADWIKR